MINPQPFFARNGEGYTLTLVLKRFNLREMLRKEGVIYAGLLHEMPCEERDKGRQSHNHEERQAGDPGCLPRLWHKSIPNRQGLSRSRHCR